MMANVRNQAANVRVLTLKLDGRDVSAREDETLLDVARENGVHIPTLCHLDGLCEVGACRLCLVEVAGVPKLLPACITRPHEGMDVTTNSERLIEYRRMIVELLFAERNHVCSVCVANGRCELQSMAQQQGITHISMPYRYPSLPVDASHPLFRLDHNRCILCTRCVRVCAEIEGAHTWDVASRGILSRITADLNEPWGDAESCTRCGKCVQVCPTGALSEKGTAVAEVTKRRSFIAHLLEMRSNGSV